MIHTLMLMTMLAFPQVSMSIGQVESGMKITAVGKAGERGAFQVREKYWGKVPKTLKGQMEQHNDILLDLVNEHGTLPKAIKAYNGKGSKAKRYLGLITQETLERELLGVI